jgi:hypothetical protein
MRVRLMILITGVMAASLLSAGAVQAGEHQIDFGFRGGYYAGTDGPFLGAEVVLPFVEHIKFNPNLEVAFGDNLDTWTANADAFIEFPLPSPTKVWAGGGPAILFRDYSWPSSPPGRPPHPKDDDVDLGLNALAGVGWQADTGLMFYLQGKIVLTNDVEGVFGFGIRF